MRGADDHIMKLMLCAHRSVTCAYCAVYFTPALVYSNCVIACPGPPFPVDGGRARSSLVLRSVDHQSDRRALNRALETQLSHAPSGSSLLDGWTSERAVLSVAQ